MKRVKYKDTYVYVNDNPVDIEKTGVLVDVEDNDEDEKKLEKTRELKIDLEAALEDTNTDIWGDSDE